MIGLILLFSSAVAATLLWLGGVLFYIYAKIGFPNLFALPMEDLTMLAATAFLPAIFLWMVVGLIYNVMTLKKHGNTINLLLTQTRRSADHAEAMVRTLMETQLQTRSAMVLHNADLFINELNDLLADIIVRLGLIQPAHTELVWQRVGDGNRWAFCKVILNNAENSPKFQNDLKDQLMRDKILSHSIRTFCYRFEQMFTMLERHDIEHYLTKIFEEGAMGRVYLRFVDACRAVEAPIGQRFETEEEASGAFYTSDDVSSIYEEPEYAQGIQEYETEEQTYEVPRYEAQVDYNEQPPLYEEQSMQDQRQEANIRTEAQRHMSFQDVEVDAASPFGFLKPTR